MYLESKNSIIYQDIYQLSFEKKSFTCNCNVKTFREKKGNKVICIISYVQNKNSYDVYVYHNKVKEGQFSSITFVVCERYAHTVQNIRLRYIS